MTLTSDGYNILCKKIFVYRFNIENWYEIRVHATLSTLKFLVLGLLLSIKILQPDDLTTIVECRTTQIYDILLELKQKYGHIYIEFQPPEKWNEMFMVMHEGTHNYTNLCVWFACVHFLLLKG